MRSITALFILAAGAAVVSVPERTDAQDAGDLAVTLASARFGGHRRTGEPRHALKIKGTFPDLAALQEFDPADDALLVRVGGVTVLDVPAAADPEGYRFRTRRREVRKWRYRARGESGNAGLRKFSAQARTGRFKLLIERADLTRLRNADPGDITVSVTMGNATATTSFAFAITSQSDPTRWVFRIAPPPAPPPPGPVVFTSLVSSSLPNTPRPHVEIARTQQEFDATWVALGSPGPQPAVDFSQDMVVVVSALVRGPGPFPPILDVVAVRDRGLLEIDWRLSLCEENLCPGAPIPCPTATPFHVFKTRQHLGPVDTRQQPTLGVCP